MSLFKKGQFYNRQELHNNYGGNHQSGIAHCVDYPIIFIFTSSGGKKHGYEDGWHSDGYFYYTGEGQEGDMTFTRGNKALLNHINEGNGVHLFEETDQSGYWEYIDQLRLIDYEYFEGSDRNNDLRKAIRFKFRPIDKIPGTESETSDESDESSIPNDRNKPGKTERMGLVTSRVGQGWYRSALLDRWDHKCAVTGCNIKSVLIASHIVPWRDSSDEERLDVENGILLSPNLDALFDRYLITFSENGGILISDQISESEYQKLGISGDMYIGDLSKGNRKYLEIHREKFYGSD